MKNNIQNYKVLAELNTNNLEDLVNQYLKEGYQLLGPPFSNSVGLYCQALGKESNEGYGLKDAVRELQAHLMQDGELYEGYKANIAMAMYDVLKNNSKFETAGSDGFLIDLCNQGADNFLQQFIK